MLRSRPDDLGPAVIRTRPRDRTRRALLAATALAMLTLSPALAASPKESPTETAAKVAESAETETAARLPRARPTAEPELPPADVPDETPAEPASDSAAADASSGDSPPDVPASAESATAPDEATELPAIASPSDLPLPRPRPEDADAPATAGAEAAEKPENSEVSEVEPAPLPRPRPELTAAEAAHLLATQFYGFAPDFPLRAALDAVKDGRYTDARIAAAAHEDPLAASLVDWLVARQPDSGMSAAEVVDSIKSHPGWPEPERLQLRAEQAFHAAGASGESVLAFYTLAEPLTVGGRLSLAGALREAGRGEEANTIVRDLWRNWSLGSGQAATVLARFGATLTRGDHLYRFRRLVLREHSADAAAQAELLGPGYEAFATAVIAVLDRRKNAAQLLRDASSRFFDDPLYVFARAHLLLRAGQPIEAARFLLESRPDLELSGDGDIWWEERQDLARALLDRGTPDLAYRIVTEARPEGEGERVLAAFHAGWIALRFLHDPRRAEPHFRELNSLATLPRTRSRADYWLGRTHEAEERIEAARLDYGAAARFGGTFYGQLAREKLGLSTTGMERMPEPSALDRMRFAGRDLVKVVRLLAAAGHADLAYPFLQTLGESVDTPGEVTLLSTLARRIGRTDGAIGAAMAAEERGLKVACLPALFVGVPAGLRPPDPVDRALVYAVARQESAFNHTAVSHVGARGLMQLMPATARATARNARIPFSVQKLTTDPLYNATLGAHHLGELLGGLRRSYVLTFVGYNAGPGRALDWVRAYGDPRGGGVDPVDWIERIPFDETRDYVQKVMENLQLYRSRIGHPLSLSEDLVRGGPQG